MAKRGYKCKRCGALGIETDYIYNGFKFCCQDHLDLYKQANNIQDPLEALVDANPQEDMSVPDVKISYPVQIAEPIINTVEEDITEEEIIEEPIEEEIEEPAEEIVEEPVELEGPFATQEDIQEEVEDVQEEIPLSINPDRDTNTVDYGQDVPDEMALTRQFQKDDTLHIPNLQDNSPEQVLSRICNLVHGITYGQASSWLADSLIKMQCNGLVAQGKSLELIEDLLIDKRESLQNTICRNVYKDESHVINYLFAIVRNTISYYIPPCRNNMPTIDSNPADNVPTEYHLQLSKKCLQNLLGDDEA